MARKLLKASGKRKIAAKRAVMEIEKSSVVLVGTYREKQLAWIKANGIYNWPVSDEGGRAVSTKPPCDDCREVSPQPAVFANVKELWLYAGAKAKRHCFVAEFVGIQSKVEFLAANPTYAKKVGKPKHAQYAVFKTKLYDYGPKLEGKTVVARAIDFATGRGQTKKIAAAIKQFHADGEFAPLADYLPTDLAKVPLQQLRVCEAAVQLDFTSWLEAGDEPFVLPMIQEEGCSCAYESEHGKLFTGDSLQWMKGIEANSIDMVFADPPYSIGKAAWDCFASHEQYLEWCEKWVAEVSRILKDSGTCYICGFSEILADVKYRTQCFFNGCRWIVWHYKNKANLGNDWGRSHESILHFRKAKTTRINVDDIRIPYNAHTLRYPSHPQSETSAYGNGKYNPLKQWRPNEHGAKPKDVFDIPTTCNGMGEKTPHPTQKPEELVRKLVLASSRPGEVVLDPFSGSGTTAVVAQQLHRRWLACDMNAQYNEWAISRLRNVGDHTVDYWIDLDRETCRRRESNR